MLSVAYMIQAAVSKEATEIELPQTEEAVPGPLVGLPLKECALFIKPGVQEAQTPHGTYSYCLHS